MALVWLFDHEIETVQRWTAQVYPDTMTPVPEGKSVNYTSPSAPVKVPGKLHKIPGHPLNTAIKTVLLFFPQGTITTLLAFPNLLVSISTGQAIFRYKKVTFRRIWLAMSKDENCYLPCNLAVSCYASAEKLLQASHLAVLEIEGRQGGGVEIGKVGYRGSKEYDKATTSQ